MTKQQIQERFGNARVIPVPVPFGDLGMTTDFVIEVYHRLRRFMIADVCNNFGDVDEKEDPADILTDENVMKHIRDKFLKKSIQYFDDVWQKYNYRFGNKTHTNRKISLVAMHSEFEPHKNVNAFAMNILGHASPTASFNYLSLTILPTVRVTKVALEHTVSVQQLEMDDLKKQVAELTSMLQGLLQQAPMKENTSHVALKKIGWTEGNREKVNVDVLSNVQVRELNRRFPSFEDAAKEQHVIKNANEIAKDLHEQGVSKYAALRNIEKLGVPRSMAGFVRTRLAVLQE
jgi:hypothetical protein